MITFVLGFMNFIRQVVTQKFSNYQYDPPLKLIAK